MTVTTTGYRKAFSGNGSTQVFTTDFVFLDETELVVTLVAADGTETVQTITTDYTVSGGSGATGSVTMLTAPASGETLVIERDTTETQLIDFIDNDPFPAETAEQGFDRAMLVLQENLGQLARTLRQPISDTAGIARLPNSTTRANKYLAFDANGDPIAAADPGSYPASAFGASLIDDADASAALTTLGFSAFAKTLIDDADAATARSTLGLLPYLGRNVLINGSFAVWQRGTSFTPGGGATTYTADRWAVLRGAANYTVSRQGTVEQYSLRSQRDSGTTDVDQIHAVQIIEGVNCAPLVGQTVQVSFDAKAGANFSPGSSAITIDFATGTSADEGFSGFINGTWTGYALQQSVKNVTTAWVRYTAEFTVPSSAKEVGLNIKWLPTGTAGANDWLELRNIKIEVGDEATDFQHRPFTHELALCQRYFAKTFPIATAPAEGAGLNGALKGKAVTVTDMEPFANWRYPVEMRTTPTVTLYNPRAAGTDGQWDDFSSLSSASARVHTNSSGGCTLDNGGIDMGQISVFIHAAADAEL